jgi:hypothetical protein
MTHYVPYILVHMPHELKLGYVNLSYGMSHVM